MLDQLKARLPHDKRCQYINAKGLVTTPEMRRCTCTRREILEWVESLSGDKPSLQSTCDHAWDTIREINEQLDHEDREHAVKRIKALVDTALLETGENGKGHPDD